jgi:DNA N-6-adenine-methyltransferase (Dam)
LEFEDFEEVPMVDNYEKAKGESSEWRSPQPLLDAIGLEYGLDPCAPMGGYYAVRARKVFTAVDNGLVRSWRGFGLVFCNSPWSNQRRGVVPWLRKFFTEADGGIFIGVARTSCDWWHELVLPCSELICFPDGKTRFYRPEGSLGPEPTNGIGLIAKGEVCCDALRRSGLGFCLFVDRTAAPSARALANVRVRDRLALPRDEGDCHA